MCLSKKLRQLATSLLCVYLSSRKTINGHSTLISDKMIRNRAESVCHVYSPLGLRLTKNSEVCLTSLIDAFSLHERHALHNV